MIPRRLMNNDKIVSEQVNEPTILDKCKGSYFNGLNVYGKSTQVTTKGYQLLNPEIKKINYFGIDIIFNDGIVSFKGTRNEQRPEIRPSLNLIIKQYVKENKTIYAKSDNANIIVDFYVITSSGENLYKPKYKVIGDEKEINFRIIYGKNPVPSGTKIDAVAKVMVTYDEIAEWEPYTGGQPSPSPEYPQLINSVGGSNNLFQIVKENITTRDGFKSVINSDGSLTVTGTPSRQFAIAYGSRINLPTGTYYISDGHNKADEIIFQMEIEYTDNKKRYYNNMAFNIDSTVKTLKLTIQYQSSDLQPVNCTFYPMLNKGDKPLPFEKYVDSIDVNVNGGNLLKRTQKFPITQNGMTLSQNIDGSYHLSGTAISDGNIRIVDPDIETYVLNIPKCTLSLKIKNGEYDGILVVSNAKNNEWKTLLSVRKNHMSTGSLISDKIGCFVTFTSGVTYNVDLYPMLNAGSTPLPFEPYKQPQTLILTTPNGLPGIPLSDENTDMDITPTYVDKDGKRWVCDEIDLKRGKYVQRVKEINPADYDNWILDNATDPIRFNLFKIPDTINERKRFEILSNRFVFGSNNVHKVGISFTYGDKIYFYLPSTVTTVEQAKQWFIDNLTTLMYMLGEPIERDLTPEEIASYKSVHTYATNTTITSEPNVSMNVIYRKLRN